MNYFLRNQNWNLFNIILWRHWFTYTLVIYLQGDIYSRPERMNLCLTNRPLSSSLKLSSILMVYTSHWNSALKMLIIIGLSLSFGCSTVNPWWIFSCALLWIANLTMSRAGFGVGCLTIQCSQGAHLVDPPSNSPCSSTYTALSWPLNLPKHIQPKIVPITTSSQRFLGESAFTIWLFPVTGDATGFVCGSSICCCWSKHNYCMYLWQAVSTLCHEIFLHLLAQALWTV